MIAASQNGQKHKTDVPPHSLDAEQSVIGSFLLDPPLLDSTAKRLRPDDFHTAHCRRVFDEMLAMQAAGVPLNGMILAQRLKAAGADEIVRATDLENIVESVPTATNANYYAEQVRLKAEQRRAWYLSKKLAELAQDDFRAGRNYPAWRAEIEAIPSLVFPHSTINEHDDGIATAADLMAEDLPEIKWIVFKLLAEGLSVLAGKPKFGKSWLALAIAIAVACGGMALGKIPVPQGSVLYLPLEDNKRRMRKRLAKLLQGERAPRAFHYPRDCTWQRVDEGGIDRMRRWLDRHDDARLIVVDTLKKIRPKRQRGANAYDEDYEAAMPLKALADEYGVSIVVITHTRKAKADDVIDEVSGTLGLSACADSILVAKRGVGSRDGSLYLTGRDVEETTYGLTWHANDCLWELVGEIDDTPPIGPERQAIIDILAAAVPERLGPSEVAEKLGKTDSKDKTTIRKLMSLMAAEGQIEAVARGEYTVCNSLIHIHNVHIGDVPSSPIHIHNQECELGEEREQCESYTPCE